MTVLSTMSGDSKPGISPAWGEKKTEKGEMKKNKEEEKKGGTPTWREFTQNTTFHGVKYVFDGTSKLRRWFWLIIVIAAIAFFVSQVSFRIVEYYKYQTVISVKRILSDKVDFPAVTFCNLNQFRISVADKMKLYECIDGTFSSDVMTRNNSCEATVENMNLTCIVTRLGHQMEQLIDNCWWKGRPCNLKLDLVSRHTDIGLCFTFNFNPMEQKTISETGPDGGLKLLLNIEKYEHMRGPNMDSGVKFLLHDPHDLPSMKDSGFVATPGEHTFVSISHTKTETLPFPYGDCALEGDSMAECNRKCFHKDFMDVCECRDTYMDDISNATLCSLHQRLSCPCNNRISRDNVTCQSQCQASCRGLCKTNSYLPTLSSSQLSRINMDTFALVGEEKKEATNVTFIKAREVQLQKSDTWTTLMTVASSVVATYTTINDLLTQYNFKGPASAYKDLPQFAKTFDKDMTSAFNPKILKRAQKGKGCSVDEDLETIFDLAGVLMFIIDTAHTAMEKDANNCSDFSNWADKIAEIYEDGYDDIRKECLLEDNAVNEILLETCAGEAKTECSCQISEYLDDYAEQAIEYVGKLHKLYKADLLSMVGSDDLNATKFQMIPDHFSCQERIIDLQKVVPELLPLLVNLTQPLTKADENNYTFTRFITDSYSSGLPMVPKVFNMTARLTQGSDVSVVLNPCCWPQWYIFDESALTETPYAVSPVRNEGETHFSLAESRIDNMDTKELVAEVDNIKKEKVWKSMSYLKDLIGKIEAFLSSQTTAFEMAGLLDTPVVPRLATELLTTGELFIDKLVEIREQLHEIDANFDGYVDILHNQLMVQMLRDADIQDSKIIPFIRKNGDSLIEIITSNCANKTFKSLPSIPEMQIFAKYVCSMIQYITDDIQNLIVQLNTFEIMFVSLQSILKEYASGTKMNDDFYMENFLQVDLYYEQLQYEKIEEQPSFVLGSLFSEVGGFLGLLLGASVMTVCELVDYLILLWGKRKREEQSVKPFNAGY